ncbi:hypothetical protein D3C81_1322250 [compost metagenome]
MVACKQVEATLQGRTVGVPVHPCLGRIPSDEMTVAGDRVDGAIAEDALGVPVHFHAHGIKRHCPVFAETVLQANVTLRGLLVAGVPVCGQCVLTRQFQVVAVDGARQPREVDDTLCFLITAADGQQCVGTKVELQISIRHFGGHVTGVVEILAILIGNAQPPAHIALFCQRAGDIRLGAIVVPAAGRRGKGQLVVCQCTFAHHVDSAAGITGP